MNLTLSRTLSVLNIDLKFCDNYYFFNLKTNLFKALWLNFRQPVLLEVIKKYIYGFFYQGVTILTLFLSRILEKKSMSLSKKIRYSKKSILGNILALRWDYEFFEYIIPYFTSKSECHISVFYVVFYFSFLPFYGMVGLWNSFFLIIYSLCNLSILMKFSSR